MEQKHALVDEHAGEQRVVIKTRTDSKSVRIITEARMEQLTAANLRAYRQKVMSMRDEVHQYGTPQAIRAIDFAATAAARITSRRQWGVGKSG